MGVVSHLFSKCERIIIQKCGSADGCGGRLGMEQAGKGAGEWDLLRRRQCRPGWPL